MKTSNFSIFLPTQKGDGEPSPVSRADALFRGGGSCETLPLTTAWGTSYNISGRYRLSFMKNGSYYDVDRGVGLDYPISSYDRYYDWEALAEYIRNLY